MGLVTRLVTDQSATGAVGDTDHLFTDESRGVPRRPAASRTIWRRLQKVRPHSADSLRLPWRNGNRNGESARASQALAQPRRCANAQRDAPLAAARTLAFRCRSPTERQTSRKPAPLPDQELEDRAGRSDGDALVRRQGQQVIVAGDDGVDAGFDRGLEAPVVCRIPSDGQRDLWRDDQGGPLKPVGAPLLWWFALRLSAT